MTTPKVTSDLWHKLLTIAITIMIVVVGYLATAVHSVSKSNRVLSDTVILMGADITNHNLNANKYIAQIEDHTTRLFALEKNSITRAEALAIVESLRIEVEKNYQRK